MYLSRNKSKNLHKEQGITLIALVVTIVVLLILAGVSISMLSGDDGIITNAGKAKDENDQSTLEEEVKLALSSNNIEKQTGGVGNLEEKLNKIQGATVTKPAEDTYYVEREGHEVTVYEDGTMEGEKIDIWDGTSKEKPEVDELGNWHIYTTNQMKFFADYCNDKLTEEEKATMPEITDSTTVYLENNLDMGARQKDGELTSGTAWTPVNMRKGIFEGKEHSISGIYEKLENMSCGLFVYANTIQNLSIKNSYIEGKSMSVGGIVATCSSAIINCHNINKVVKNNYTSSCFTGGIVGISYTTINITNCTNSGNIISTLSSVGGIVGCPGMLLANNTIESCANYGTVNGIEFVGGIVGMINVGCTITNSYNSGEIVGNSYVGGIIGSNAQAGVITNCYNKGMISGNTKVGAIIGNQNGNVTSNISNLYYLNTLPIKAINNQDYETQNIRGISEDFNSYEKFINWIQ